MDMSGRVDLALLRAGEFVVKRKLEPRIGFPVWDRGLGDFVRAFVTERLNVPTTPVTLVDVARELGILPRSGRQKRGPDVLS